MNNCRYYALSRAIRWLADGRGCDYALKELSAKIASIEFIRLTTLRCSEGQILWLAIPQFDF